MPQGLLATRLWRFRRSAAAKYKPFCRFRVIQDLRYQRISWLSDVIDDTTMNALFNQEAKLYYTEKRLQHLTEIICPLQSQPKPEKLFLLI